MVLLLPTALAAQSSGTPSQSARAEELGSDSVGARALSLHVAPAAGDVLRLQMQQVIEMTGARKPAVLSGGALAVPSPVADSAPSVGPRRDRLPTQVTIMDFYAHSTVQSGDSTGSILLAETDSLLVRTGLLGQALVTQRLPITSANGATRVRVSRSGAMTLLDASGRTASVGATLSAMPAMLPDAPVAVGESWERDVRMPPLPLTRFRADGVLRTTFTLDSTTREGRDAYVSVRGVLHRDGTARELPAGARVVTDGTLRGTLVLDRTRGWITDARTTIEVRSDVVSANGAGAPMQIAIRISQRMQVR